MAGFLPSVKGGHCQWATFITLLLANTGVSLGRHSQTFHDYEKNYIEKYKEYVNQG
jgi:hypothetical protein